MPEDYNKTFKYLEIGSFEGLSSLFVLSYWKNANITCVDTWQISKDKSQVLDFNFENVEKKFDSNLQDFSFKKIKNTSEGAFKQLSKKDSFDYIYILNVGGIIIFDDINNIYNEIEMQPHDAFEKFYTLYKKKIKILYLKNIAVIKKTNF